MEHLNTIPKEIFKNVLKHERYMWRDALQPTKTIVTGTSFQFCKFSITKVLLT
jgi:hypothetical protein